MPDEAIGSPFRYQFKGNAMDNAPAKSANPSIEDQLASLLKRVRQLEDIEDIRRLRATYASYADGGWPEHGPNHMGPLAELFVEDGVWDGRPMIPLADGREEIRRIISEGSRPVRFVMHYVSNANIHIAEDGKTASGKWHIMAPYIDPDGRSNWLLGTYDEQYVRTTDGWRFQLLRFVPARKGVQEGGWTEEWPTVHDFADTP
jgi:SnoaL-like domain